jgi:hypothetical protein
METIVIETTAVAAAEAPSAPHVCPPPPVGAVGISAGPFPGGVALDYQPLRANILNITKVGPSLIINGQMAGLAVGASIEGVSPHLYLFAGAAHEFKITPDPKLLCGAGWRF